MQHGGVALRYAEMSLWLRRCGDAARIQTSGEQVFRRMGAESSLTNALSEHAAFGLTAQRAQQLVAEVARVVSGWQAHFLQVGVSVTDIQTLAQYIDRPFLKTQRDAVLSP
ncbi:hypothetical protein B9Z39_03455 [Limnohabitans sp. JirII-29]|nr:hypothetical protein B9Z39_03455 [Limnohabitans sp. JirII-29]